MVFNGELYNYRELRERLTAHADIALQHNPTPKFWCMRGKSGARNALSELRGMFAFAIADFRKHYTADRSCFLARDPLGIKPLYYTQTGEGFAFASEVGALMAERHCLEKAFAGCANVVSIIRRVSASR